MCVSSDDDRKMGETVVSNQKSWSWKLLRQVITP